MASEEDNITKPMPREMGPSISMSESYMIDKAEVEKQTLAKHQSLAQSKGRGQITATTAMSIVNVALLKSVIDHGPKANRFYFASLILISVSLALQIIAGLVSLVIENTLSYLNKFDDNEYEDCKMNCCPCTCEKAPKKKSELRESQTDVETSFIYQETETDTLDDNTSCICCGYKCSSEVYEHYEISILEGYFRWKRIKVKSELKAVRAKDELKHQVQVIAESGKKLTELSEELKDKTDPAVRENIEKQIEDVQKTLKEANARKEECDNIIRKATVNGDVGTILQDSAESIRKNRVLRMAAFWQHVLNYMFYVIFVLNAFITGFGIASSPQIQGDPPILPEATPAYDSNTTIT